MPEQRILHQRYRIDGLIGRGGMADVMRGWDLVLQRVVAVKMMRPDLARDPQFQARFRREARSAAALNHPAIVSVYDTGSVPLEDGHHHPVDCPYLVMEFVDGDTLRDLVQREEIPWEKAVEWTSGLLEALAHSHAEGIVHRDVKPANVMVSRTGEVKVMDFGIARALSDSSAQTSQTQAVVGTALYIAPEQAQGGAVDARSDLYAVGCVLFELLTGRPPFTGETPLAVAFQHVRQDPPAPSEVDPRLPTSFDAVLLKALQKDPARRHQSAEEFLAALESAAADPHVAAPLPESEVTQALPVVGATAGAAATGGTADSDASATDPAAAPEPARPAADALPDGAGRAREDSRPEPSATTLSPSHVVAGAAAPGAATAAQLAAVADVDGDPSEPATGQHAVAVLGPITGRQRAVTPEEAATASRPARTRPRRGVLLLGLLSLLTLLGVVLAALLFDDRQRVDVPSVVGLREAEALTLLDDAGLRPHVVREAVAGRPDGEVAATDPAAGTRVPQGATVRVSVAQAGDGVVLPPSLHGAPESAVREELQALGLTVSSVEFAESGTLARGELVETEPALGSRVPRGTAVVLRLSDGTVRLPDVGGMSGRDAGAALSAVAPDLSVRFQAPEGVDAATATVVQQDPPGGALVDNTSTVTLRVSAEAPPTAPAADPAPSAPSSAPDSGTTRSPDAPTTAPTQAPSTPAAPTPPSPTDPATSPSPSTPEAPTPSETAGPSTDPAPPTTSAPPSTTTPSTDPAPTDPPFSPPAASIEPTPST